MDLSGVGVWSGELRYGNAAESAEAAAELEELGFRALWIPDVGVWCSTRSAGCWRRPGGRSWRRASSTCGCTLRGEAAASFASLSAAHGDRFLMGIGVSHAPLVDASEPGRYRKPLSAMTAFLDGLDQADAPVPAEKRVLAALGPKMLELAVRRTGGVHPYLVPPEHTRLAREAVRDGALVLPEQPVILCSTRDEARAIGNEWLRGYLSPAQLPGQRTAPGVLGRGRGVP